ncbi:unnamed protein product, partial [Mesorhabditis belari]|uniref:Uncharacterized protein n=1 Tax=Mesorhabditis belari TaxID=2138241 RepID=A0AAF3J8J2_9BILA
MAFLIAKIQWKTNRFWLYSFYKDKEKLLNFTNLRVCQAERFSTEKFCVSHLPIDWPCIRAVELCNGNRDCPNGEDEEPNMCMFHSLNQGLLRQLQRDFLRFSGATPSSTIYGIRLTTRRSY